MELNTKVFETQFIIFFLMACGYFLGKKGMITEKGRKEISDLLISLILPANIIVSFTIQLDEEVLRQSAIIFTVAVLIQALSILLSKVLYRRVPEDKRTVVEYSTIVSNAGFMGSAVSEGIFGSLGLMYNSIYLIPLRIVMWTVGLSHYVKVNFKQGIKNILTHPCLVAIWIGLFFMATQLKLPPILDSTLRYIGRCNLPISMIMIGCILAEVDKTQILSRLNVFFTVVRLLLIPLLSLILCLLFGAAPMTTGVCVILAGMPAGSTTAILAQKYDKNAKFATEIVFLSTLLSLVTIPLLYYLVAFIVL